MCSSILGKFAMDRANDNYAILPSGIYCFTVIEFIIVCNFAFLNILLLRHTPIVTTFTWEALRTPVTSSVVFNRLRKVTVSGASYSDLILFLSAGNLGVVVDVTVPCMKGFDSGLLVFCHSDPLFS